MNFIGSLGPLASCSWFLGGTGGEGGRGRKCTKKYSRGGRLMPGSEWCGDKGLGGKAGNGPLGNTGPSGSSK